MALALTDQPPNADLYNLSDYDSSDSENENDFLPPGPLDPAKCTLSGPGFIGGSAGSPTSFVLTAKDTRSKRVTDGGDYVTVQVRPIRNAAAETLQATVKDQGDGSYTVTYSVTSRGNYEVLQHPLLMLSLPCVHHTSCVAEFVPNSLCMSCHNLQQFLQSDANCFYWCASS